MEKICTVLWKPAGASDDAFRDALLAEAPELARRGAMRLRIDAVDGHVAAGTRVRISRNASRRTSGSTRSRSSRPSRWSISCWIMRARRSSPSR